MTFFRQFLKEHDQEPDYRFEERDESWFVFALLLIRLGFRLEPWLPRFPWLPFAQGPAAARRIRDPLAKLTMGPETRSALDFVSKFLCFFVTKPPEYKGEIDKFKDMFIPGFATTSKKQRELFDLALPSFSETPVEEAVWDTVNHYFKVDFEADFLEHPRL